MWKLRVEKLSRGKVKYECQAADFHETLASSTIFFVRTSSIEFCENLTNDLVAG